MAKFRFDFRYNTREMTDGERAVLAVKGGKRMIRGSDLGV
jgi:hypothetical protein